MIVLGVALVIIALLIGGFVAIGGSSESANQSVVSAFGVDITTTAVIVFLAGAATLLILVVGLWMIRWGATRHVRTRSEIHRLRRIEAEVAAQQAVHAGSDSRSGSREDWRHESRPGGSYDEDWPAPQTRPFERAEPAPAASDAFVKRPEPAAPGTGTSADPRVDPVTTTDSDPDRTVTDTRAGTDTADDRVRGPEGSSRL